MNELSELFRKTTDGERILLEAGRTYHVCQDDSFVLDGYYCSNSAKIDENPTGRRYTAMYLKGKKNVTVDGNGAQVLVHGKMTPILLDQCENITFKNLTIDYACPTMAEITVVSCEGGEYILKINPECRFRLEGHVLFWRGEDGLDGVPYWEDVYISRYRLAVCYDPVKKISRGMDINDLAFESVTQLDETTLRVRLKNKDAKLPVGSILQTRNIIRDQVGGLFQRSKNVTLENLRVKFMHGLGLVAQFCENVTYRNCDFTPGQGRTIASTADFFHFSGCKGEIVLEGCRSWGAQDDHINVHGTHLRIVEKNEEERSILVRFMHPETWGLQAFEAGDEIEFIRWDTLIPYASNRVAGYERLNDTDIRLCLDGPLPEMEVGRDVVENATWTANVYVRGCEFLQTSCRGILCTTRGEVIIENNRFYHLRGPALVVEDDCNFWFESGYTRHIIFRNNRVTGCNYGMGGENSPAIQYTPKVMREDSAEFVHGKLTLTGNRFEEPPCGRYAIRLEYLREADIRDNFFDTPCCVQKRCVGRILEENNRTGSGVWNREPIE